MPRPPSPTTTAASAAVSPRWLAMRVLGSVLLVLVLIGFAATGSARAQTTAALPSAPPRTAVVDARLGIHPDKTRFVLELSDAVSFTVSMAADPYRIIVDLPDLAWPG